MELGLVLGILALGCSSGLLIGSIGVGGVILVGVYVHFQHRFTLKFMSATGSNHA